MGGGRRKPVRTIPYPGRRVSGISTAPSEDVWTVARRNTQALLSAAVAIVSTSSPRIRLRIRCGLDLGGLPAGFRDLRALSRKIQVETLPGPELSTAEVNQPCVEYIAHGVASWSMCPGGYVSGKLAVVQYFGRAVSCGSHSSVFRS